MCREPLEIQVDNLKIRMECCESVVAKPDPNLDLYIADVFGTHDCSRAVDMYYEQHCGKLNSAIAQRRRLLSRLNKHLCDVEAIAAFQNLQFSAADVLGEIKSKIKVVTDELDHLFVARHHFEQVVPKAKESKSHFQRFIQLKNREVPELSEIFCAPEVYVNSKGVLSTRSRQVGERDFQQLLLGPPRKIIFLGDVAKAVKDFGLTGDEDQVMTFSVPNYPHNEFVLYQFDTDTDSPRKVMSETISIPVLAHIETFDCAGDSVLYCGPYSHQVQLARDLMKMNEVKILTGMYSIRVRLSFDAKFIICFSGIVLLCLSTETNQKIWSYDLFCFDDVVIVGDRVIVYGNNVLTILDLETGKLISKKFLGFDYDSVYAARGKQSLCYDPFSDRILLKICDNICVYNLSDLNWTQSFFPAWDYKKIRIGHDGTIYALVAGSNQMHLF
jgi:hypothetical protein